MVVQGTITKEKEARWYAFVVNENSKFSIVAQMADSLDADLYLFSLNSTTSELELLGGSANAGVGVTEHTTGVLKPGVYFFAIQGYEGIGNYAFAFYQNTNITNEPNDTYDTATATELGSTLTGEIDNPYDVDYYKITLTNAVLMNYSFMTDANYKMELTTSDGKGFTIPEMNNAYKLFPGTYYLKVSSKDLSYSPTKKYTITTTKLSDMSSDSNASILGVCAKANIFYETDTKKIHYVNGHKIDTSYSYEADLSNSAGVQLYNMHIYESRITGISMSNDYKPEIVRYISSTQPIMNVKTKNVLSLTFLGDALYTIHNYGSGAYKMNTYSDDMDVVNVLIDPDTGKLIDILELNYFYQIVPVGNNRISVTHPGYAFNFYN